MRVFDDYLNNPQYWKKHWAHLLYNRAKSMYDYIRYFNPNWVILNDAANKNPWKRFSEFATPDSSITPFTNEELIDNKYVKILHIGEVGQEENSYIILASKLYWREGILNSFLKKAYIWGGDQDLWIYYGGTVDANGDWRISPFLLEQLNSVNEKPLKFAELEFYNSNLPQAIDLAATDLHRETPAKTKDIETEVDNGDLSIYYGLSDSLIPSLVDRPLLQLPTSYVVFNNYQPIFDDPQGELRNILSFEKHMLIIPMSSSLVYSIIAAYDNNTISFIGRPVETNGNIRQILFSYNPLPSRFTSKEPFTTDFSLNKTYYNHSYNANTGQDEINIYDFTNHAVWNGESFLEHETYFHNDNDLPIDEMILDETVEFAFFNIDNSISHGYTINVKNNPSQDEHLRVLY